MTDGARRVALVTGAASGIGRAAAVALAGAGYDVAVNYRRRAGAARETAAAAEQEGARTILCRCDVSDDAAVRAMAGEVEAAFGRLDVLVNNAGISVDTPPDDLEGLGVEDWDRVMAVNVKGVWLTTRACVPLLRRAPEPCIVNTASIAGLRPGPQPLPYAASKAAVVNLTKTLAAALAPEIRVNAVAPGWMRGDWMEHALGDNYEGLMARRARYTPMQRNVEAEDVADTMLSLIERNRFVTGEIIVVDGGFANST